MIIAALAFSVALLVALTATPLITRAAVALRWYDLPERDRRVHTTPIPRLGGVAVFAGFAIAIAVAFALVGPDAFAVPSGNLLGVLGLGGAIIFLTGVVDDVRGTRPRTKLFAQTVAASVAFAYGCRIEFIGFGDAGLLSLGWMSFPATILWIVMVTNAFNLIDGLDGLATGMALVALTTILTAAALLGNPMVLLPGAALVGSLLGFLRYNYSPAKIFLGDSGSLFTGFSLAVLSVVGSLKTPTAILAVVPLFAVGLPLMDTLLAVFRRWLRGLPLSEADTRHVHHRLIALGLTHRRAVAVLYAAATFLGMMGLSLAFGSPRVVWVVSVLGGTALLLLFLYGLRRLNYHEFGEALGVLSSAPERLRRAVRDQIFSQDIADMVSRCTSVAEINELLTEHAGSLGLLQLEICDEAQPVRLPRLSLEAVVTRPWRLDYPITQARIAGNWVVRVWCNSNASRPYGAERVARILAPAIALRMGKLEKGVEPVEAPTALQAGQGARMDRPSGAHRRELH